MSLKPVCESPDALSNFTYKEFKGKLFKAIKKLAKVHDKPETAAPFYLCTEQKFADAEGKFFLIFGKLGKWKNYSKTNAVKVKALRGLCYVSLDASGKSLVLNLMPVAGQLKGKESAIAKSMKEVVNANRCAVAITKGEFSENMMEEMEKATENMQEVADDVVGDMMEDQVEEAHNLIDEAKKSNLTPEQSKQLDDLAADVESIENLLERMAAADDAAEIQTVDKEIRTLFAKYIGAKK